MQSKIQNYFGGSSSNITERFDKDQPLDNSELVKLLTFDPLSFNEEELEDEFNKIANSLLNNYILYINTIPHQLIEIEFYLKSDNHPDDFTHCSDVQKELGGLWYFHKSGNTYKSGTYKGLDITMASEGHYGGILIRGIINLETGEVVDGPSLCVDHILKLCKAKSIQEFVEDFDLHVHLKGKLFLAPAPNPTDYKVYRSGRVGLTLKVISETRIKYIGKFYRYLTRPKETKKGRAYLISALYAESYTPDQMIYIMSRKQKDIIENSLDDEEDEEGSFSDEEEEEIQKKSKSNTKKRAKTGVKKSITAYSYYMKDRGAKIKAENPNLTFGEISKKLSAEWKALSDEEKKPYQEKALEDKKRYEKEKQEYMETNKDGPSKKKKVKDPNAPKKNKNAYMFYTQMMRPKIIEELGPSESKKTTQITKLIGSRWNQLSNEEKKPFEEMARKDKERYEKEFAVYKKQLGEVK